MRPTRIADPAESVLTLADAKLHLRVDASDEDAYITSLIAAAEAYLDGRAGILGRCMVTQTWRYKLASLPALVPLGMPDAQSVTGTYLDAAGDTQAVSDLSVREEASGAVLVYAGDALTFDADEDYPVTVDVVFGFGDASAVPDPLLHAVRVLVGHWYEVRTSAAETPYREVPMAFHSLISAYRWLRL